MDIHVDKLRCCDLQEQGEALLAANGQETGHRELDIDWSVYHQAEAARKLLVFGAWSGEELVGYVAGFIFDKHPQHANWRYVHVDVLFVQPEYRRAGVCLQLMAAMRRAAASVRVHSVLWSAKTESGFERVLDSRDKYHKIETTYEEQL